MAVNELVITGPDTSLSWLWAQFLARPVGFGFLETFFPIPADVDVDEWRWTYWQAMNDFAIRMVADDPAIALTLGPVTPASARFNAFAGIANLIPDCVMRTCLTMAAEHEYMPYPAMPLPKPVTGFPSILQLKWHRCKFCQSKISKHVNGQCLFGSTSFEPYASTWRTVYGDFQWQKSSMSFVNTVGNTTTTTTTRAKTTARRRSRRIATK